MSDSVVVGTFPGRDITRGTGLLGTNRYCDCNNICIIGLSALWECSSIRSVVM